MFPSSSVFSCTKQPAPGQHSPREQVSKNLMLELGVLLRHTERMWQKRASDIRRQSSSVDYSWLLALPRPSFQLHPGELLELQDLCAQVPPSQCGPVILRARKLVIELEPKVSEVSRIFRSVLCVCLEEVEEDELLKVRAACRWAQKRNKSLSFITFHSHVNPLRNRTNTEEMTDEDDCSGNKEEGGEATVGVYKRSRRARRMTDITLSS